MSKEIFTQGEMVIKTFMKGARIAQVRGRLSKLKQFTTTAFEALGELDKLINEVDFQLEEIEDKCAGLSEDYRYCTEHDKELKLAGDGSFKCESCELLILTGFPYECDEHGPFERSCDGCEQNDRRMERGSL